MDMEGAGRPRPRPYVFVLADYFDAIIQAGGLPILLPPLDNDEDIRQVLAGLDGLLLTGGGDVDPSLYGRPLHPATKLASPRRLQFDLLLTKAALAFEKPILAICLGAQMLNVAAGGTLRQDLEDQTQGRLEHRQVPNDDKEVHIVTISPGSSLAKIVGTSPLGVNSTHHHAVDTVAPGFKACSTASDGVIEAIERPTGPMTLGVQWHPERLRDSDRHRSLFKALVEQAGPDPRAPD